MWIKDHEGMPCFAMIKEIYVPERDMKNILFLVHQLETKEFSGHFHAYEVNVPVEAIPLIFKQRCLKYYLPLHLVNHVGFEANGQDTRLYICPKYEHPSVE